MNLQTEVEIIRDSFGLGLLRLFSAVCGRNASASFDEKKEMLFALLEKLMFQGKIEFIAPGADCYISIANPSPRLTIQNPAARWNAPVEDILRYLRQEWPPCACDEESVELMIYFHSVPGLIWVTDDGELISS